MTYSDSDSDDDFYDPAEIDSRKKKEVKLENDLCTKSPALMNNNSDNTSSTTLQTSTEKIDFVKGSTTKTTTIKVNSDTREFGASFANTDHVLRGVTGRVRSICFSSAGSTLCAGGEGGMVCMWDFRVPLDSRAIKPTRILTPFPNRISGFQPVISVHVANDGSHYVACQDGDCPVLIASSGKQLGYCAMGERGIVDVVQCKGHRAPVTCSAPSPSVISRFFTGSQDSTARLWDTQSFERRSIYAVKHGSGQLLENVVVESIIPIQSIGNDKSSVFATGGVDGLVLLWDSRQKYRPGGALATLDMYSKTPTAGNSGSGSNRSLSQSKAMDDSPFFEEKHVGGMVEPDASRPFLCIRCGSVVRVVDLRKIGKTGVVEDVCPSLTSLSFVTDTTPLVSCTSTLYSQDKPSFLTCTSRAGYQHVAGGHVVQFTYIDGSFQPSMVWRPSVSHDNNSNDNGKGRGNNNNNNNNNNNDGDDVLTVAVDVVGGQLFAGQSSGDIVARVKRRAAGEDGEYTTTTGTTSFIPTVRSWLATRPEREGRVVGKKSAREDAFEDDNFDDVGF